MANLRSAKRRIRRDGRQASYNKVIRTSARTAVKRVEEAVLKNDAEKAEQALRKAVKELDQAASKGLYHKKTVSRKKSRLAKKVNKINA